MGDLSTAYPVLAAALILIGSGGIGFQKVYGWIQADAQKQREERDKALAEQETRIRGEFNSRILILETHIKDLDGIRKTVIAESGKGLGTDDPKEMRACFQRILQCAG